MSHLLKSLQSLYPIKKKKLPLVAQLEFYKGRVNFSEERLTCLIPMWSDSNTLGWCCFVGKHR